MNFKAIDISQDQTKILSRILSASDKNKLYDISNSFKKAIISI